MRNSVLIAAFLGCLFIHGSNAIMPMLGDGVEHPLFFWGPQHLILMFDMNSTFGEQCVANLGFSALNSMTGIFRCASAITDMSSGPAVPSPTSLCSSIQSFTTCFQEEANNIANTCSFTTEQRQFIYDAIENNEDITKSLCDDDGNTLMEYILNGGMGCASKSREGLLRCLDFNNSSGPLMYNAEGCRNAHEFAECAAEQMTSECDSEAGRIVKRVMEDALHNVCEQNDGAGQLPPVDIYVEHSEDDDDDEDFETRDGRREHRSNKQKLMKKQTNLLEDIRGLLQTAVGSLSRQEELLQAIAES